MIGTDLALGICAKRPLWAADGMPTVAGGRREARAARGRRVPGSCSRVCRARWGRPYHVPEQVFRVADRDETPTARPTVKADGKLAGGLIAGKRLGR
jgi:hypothetical protein